MSKYLMPYIDDKQLYKAVMFARRMIRNGTAPKRAIFRASIYYDCHISDVAHYVGQVASKVKEIKKERGEERGQF